MKVEIKKIKVRLTTAEWLILVDKKTVAITFAKDDAKFIAKCIRKYKKGRRDK